MSLHDWLMLIRAACLGLGAVISILYWRWLRRQG
jgi:hypothetical protein